MTAERPSFHPPLIPLFYPFTLTYFSWCVMPHIMLPFTDILLQADDGGGFLMGLGIFMVLLGLLALAVVVLSIVVVVQAYKAGRTGWWLYLIAVFMAPLNLVSVIGWFAYWKHHPVMLGDTPFL